MAYVSVRGDPASVLYSWSEDTADVMDDWMRSAKVRARSRYPVEGVPIPAPVSTSAPPWDSEYRV